jgi:hypothetical protein
VNPERLTAFAEAFCMSMVEEAKAHTRGWLLHAEDTPEAKAIRVTVKVMELIDSGHVTCVQMGTPIMERVCAELKFEPTHEGLLNYMEQ